MGVEGDAISVKGMSGVRVIGATRVNVEVGKGLLLVPGMIAFDGEQLLITIKAKQRKR